MSKKSICFVSWDCSFRNFYGGVLSLAQYAQEAASEGFDISIILVEQRSRDTHLQYHEVWGTLPCEDIVKSCDGVKVDVHYLNNDKPYDVTTALDVAVRMAIQQGHDYIGIFDCDQIFPGGFYKALSWNLKRSSDVVINLARLMEQKPERDWLESSREYYSVLERCPNKADLLRRQVHNKFPLILCRGDLWQRIDFDIFKLPLFAGNATRLGLALNTLLENQVKTDSFAMPGIGAVHPWHPTGRPKRGIGTAVKLYMQLSFIRIARKRSLLPGDEKLCRVAQEKNKQYMTVMKFIRPFSESTLLGWPLLAYMRIHRFLSKKEVASIE